MLSGRDAGAVMALEIDITREEFALFRELIYKEAGVFLKDCKGPLLKSRLLHRLRCLGHQSFMEYYRYLRESDPDRRELQEFLNAVTTHKTSFFREQHHFEYLREQLLAPAQERASLGHQQSLRIWSAGCSSGEEPYSIAITVAETLERLPAWDVKILGSDIDTSMLEHARAAIYPRDAVSGLSAEMVKQHFLSGTGEYAEYVKVRPEIQNLVTFGRVNLMDESWPFRRNFDAIFCRNVIIYFDHSSQEKVLLHFARHLKPGGLLFSGHSENLFWLSDVFEPIGHTVYRLRNREESDAQNAVSSHSGPADEN